MLVNNYLITTTELKTLGYTSLPGIAPPADSLKMVSKLTATTYYDVPPVEPWVSLTPNRVPKYQDFPIPCYCFVTIANTSPGNPDPAPIEYQDCSGNTLYSSVPFGQALILNPCNYVSGDSGPLTGCGILPGSVIASGCDITYFTRRNVPQVCTTTTTTTTTIAPNYCLIVAGYVDGADINASYNFEVCFDWYNCDLNVVTYCTGAEGGFTLPYDCYQSDLGYEAYYYTNPGGSKIPACCSYIAGYTPCSTTTTTTSTTTTIPPSLNAVSVFSSATGQTQMVGGYSSQYTALCAISTNYGATFTIIGAIFESSQPSSDDVVSNADGTLCALSTAPYIFLSNNAGISWSASNTGSGNSYLAISSNTIYLSKFPGYLLSTSDGGLSWTELTAMGFRYWGHLQALNNYLIAAVNDGTVSTKVYISHSSGTTLTYTFSYTGTPVPIYVGIAGSGQYMYVVTDGYSGKYYKSVNYGQTFSTIITNSSSQIFTSACNSKNAAYLLLFRLSNVTGQTTLMRSTNYGVSFSDITSTPFVNNSVIGSSMSDDGAYVSILVQVGGGTSPYQVWLSSDAGLTWTQKF